jgi:electron transfer flavoprotein alpha subunit
MSHHKMMSTLVLSEPIDSTSTTTPAATCSAVTAAHALQDSSEPITLLVVGSTVPSQIPSGVSKIVHYESSSNELTSEAVALAVAGAVQNDPDITHVVGASTKFGASVVPRAAAMLQVSPITDVVQILASGT